MQITLLAASEKMVQGSELTTYVQNLKFTGRVEEMSKIDRRTGKVLDADVGQLEGGETGLVKILVEGPICLERYRDYPQLGKALIIN